MASVGDPIKPAQEVLSAIVQEVCKVAGAEMMDLVESGNLATMDARQIERWVQKTLRKVADPVTNGVFTMAATLHAAAPNPQCPTCGRRMQVAQLAPRTLLGLNCDEIRINRTVYRCPDRHDRVCPLDETLGIGRSHLSPALLQIACVAGILDPFRDGARFLEETLGVRIPLSTLAPNVEAIGAVAEKEVQKEIAREKELVRDPGIQIAPLADEEVSSLLVEVDGARVHVDGAWREDKIGVIAPLSPLAKLGQEGQPEKLRPLAQTYLGGLEGVEPFYDRLVSLACPAAAALEHPVRIFAIADGAKWIWARTDRLAPLGFEVVEIVDIFHAYEHLGAVADAFFPSKSLHDRWSNAARTGLRTYGATDAIERLSALPPARGRLQKRLKRTTLAYFIERADRMRYPEYDARGWPIGSGVVESACGHVAGARLKDPGMRWSYGGAQSILTLRALYRSGPARWDAFWSRKPALHTPPICSVTYRKYATAA